LLLGDQRFRIVGLADWKRAAREGKAPQDALLRKQFLPDQIKQEGEGSYTFVISTGIRDRVGDTIAADGWDLEAYRNNPVVLFAHSYGDPPIGKADVVLARNGQLRARMRFVPADVYAFAEMIRRLVDGGFLRATSVGFNPKTWVYNEETSGVDFKTQELLEFSIVPVPANPETLIEACAAGVDLEPLKEWAVRALEGVSGPGLWLPRDVAERVLKIVSGEPVTVSVAGAPKRADAATHAGALSGSEPEPASPSIQKGVVPANVSDAKAPEGEEWSAPSLADFTPDSWENLSADQKRKIAGHYAWAAAMPPEKFGDLKLPHHSPKAGAVVWRGVAAAMSALLGGRGGVNIPSGDEGKVYAHLAAHYRQFGKEPPEKSVSGETKAGRVLSAKNEKALTDARDLLNGVIAQVADDSTSEDDSGKGVTREPRLVVLAASPPESRSFHVDPEAVRATVAEAVSAEISRRRGRLD